MKFIGIIPARYGSTRFPGKPLVMIDGKTMIQRVYEQAKQALDNVWVATDDSRIMKEVEHFGGKVFETGECKNGTERCAIVARKLLLEADTVVINIQGDQPFIDPQAIGDLIDAFKENINIATLIAPEDPAEIDNPNSVKVHINSIGDAVDFSRVHYSAYINYKHIGVYGYHVKTLLQLVELPPNANLEQMAWLDAGYKIKCIYGRYEGISVDTPEDLLKIKPKLNETIIYKIFNQEVEAIKQIPITMFYSKAVDLIYHHVHELGGKLITTGMGKAGGVAKDLATTFSSTGTPAVFLHPAEAQHGDLGVIQKNDVLLMISNSG